MAAGRGMSYEHGSDDFVGEKTYNVDEEDDQGSIMDGTRMAMKFAN